MSSLETQSPPLRLEQFASILFVFSTLITFVIFGGLVSDDLDFFRTHASAWSAALLATPALYLFARWFQQAPLPEWWRLFWSFSWIMIVIHLVFGLGVMHFWDPLSVFQRQGFFIAFPIFFLQLTWPLDIFFSYRRRDWAFSTGWFKYWQGFAFLNVFLNFFIALVIFRNDTPSLIIGLIMTAALGVALLQRLVEKRRWA